MRGFTLIEVIVVLALLGLITGMSAFALGSLHVTAEASAAAVLRQARAEAIRSGVQHTAQGILFLPDGRAVGVGVDPLTGLPHAR